MSTTTDESSAKTGLSNPELKPLQSEWRAFPCLTILFHPQLRRIGGRCLLVPLEHGQPVLLSRNEPLFSSPDSSPHEALTLSAISRSPLQLVPAPDRGVRILRGAYSMPVHVNGIPLTSEALVTAQDIAAGVVLALSETVLLLLHRFETFAFMEKLSRELAPVSGLVGGSAALIHLHFEISRAVAHENPVLLLGETGSGKELVAAAIHRKSRRHEQDMVSVNMGSVSHTLANAEFFGAERGAYTGAVRQQLGLFRKAHESTLFLDEIGDTPDDVQLLLLRVLEEKLVHPLGSDRAVPVDVRLITATDANLSRAMEEGRFREPLYHRLAGQVIHVPPLRQRRDDIGRLIVHFLVQELTAMGMAPDEIDAVLNDRKQRWLTYEQVAPLVSYHWPGNVRELRNRVSQLAIAARIGHGVVLPGMPNAFDEVATSRGERAPSSPPAPPRRTKKASLPDLSDEQIEEALRVNDWETAPAAKALKRSRQWLYDRIRVSSRLRTMEQISDEEIVAAYKACGGDMDRLSNHLKVSRRALIRRLRRMKLIR